MVVFGLCVGATLLVEVCRLWGDNLLVFFYIQFDAVSNHKVQAVEYLIECGANVRVRV